MQSPHDLCVCVCVCACRVYSYSGVWDTRGTRVTDIHFPVVFPEPFPPQERPSLVPSVSCDGQVPPPGADQVPPVGDAPLEHVDGEDPPTSPADGGGSNERYSIKVEGVEETGGKFEWTLSLKGFERGHLVYIYNNTTGKQISSGHKINNPAASLKVSAKAKGFDGLPSKRDEYGFR
jgi:hypothetical protein